MMSRSSGAILCGVFLLLGTVGLAREEGSSKKATAPTPLRQAHAHNDYYHKRPLLDALDHGFMSAEADIYLVDGELLVAHSRFELRKTKTLRKLYLDPLHERFRRHGGSIYPRLRSSRKSRPVTPFTLLIDIKDDAKKTYVALHEQLAQYREMLSVVEDGKAKAGAVRIVISGNRPQELMATQKLRFAGIDGRLGDLDSTRPAHLLPMISDHWGRNFKWRGKGPMPAEEKKKLDGIVKKAHAKGRVVRFWATPERPELWGVLRDAGVDLINTDDLPGLQKFLLEGMGKKKQSNESKE